MWKGGGGGLNTFLILLETEAKLASSYSVPIYICVVNWDVYEWISEYEYYFFATSMNKISQVFLLTTL